MKAISSSLILRFEFDFVMDSTRKTPEDQLPSASRASYADVVKRKSPLKDDSWRRFQAEDEDEAIEKALEASLEAAMVGVFSFVLVIYFRN